MLDYAQILTYPATDAVSAFKTGDLETLCKQKVGSSQPAYSSAHDTDVWRKVSVLVRSHACRPVLSRIIIYVEE